MNLAWLYLIEILHQTTTPLHYEEQYELLYLIEILHQTTTCGKCEDCLRRCILSKFYIKPQQQRSLDVFGGVVSYRNSTSNHNSGPAGVELPALYLIEILHQTTTLDAFFESQFCCILSKFYIKPQHRARLCRRESRCILSKFYIKPQPLSMFPVDSEVVSYRNSTSNHNFLEWNLQSVQLYLIEILHQTTTQRSVWLFFWCCILSKFYIKPQPLRSLR